MLDMVYQVALSDVNVTALSNNYARKVEVGINFSL